VNAEIMAKRKSSGFFKQCSALLLALAVATTPSISLGQEERRGDTAVSTNRENPDSSSEGEADVPLTSSEKAVWSLVGIASLTAITGGIFGLNAIDEKNRFDNDPNSSKDFEDRYKSRAIVSAVSLGIAGCAGIAALIVGLVGRSSDGASKSVSWETSGTSLTVTF
jgi:hypothetical protein